MILKVIRESVQFNGVNERVMEISVNDMFNIYIRASVYEKLNNGEYTLLRDNNGLQIRDRDNNIIPKINNSPAKSYIELFAGVEGQLLKKYL